MLAVGVMGGRQVGHRCRHKKAFKCLRLILPPHSHLSSLRRKRNHHARLRFAQGHDLLLCVYVDPMPAIKRSHFGPGRGWRAVNNPPHLLRTYVFHQVSIAGTVGSLNQLVLRCRGRVKFENLIGESLCFVVLMESG